MAKNYATIYADTGDVRAMNQQWFLVEETTKGVFAAPVNSSFFFTRTGGAITHNQDYDISDHRSGRHNTDIVPKKTETSWKIPMYIDIDTGVSAGTTEIDQGVRTLWKSTLGKETISSGLIYTPADDPSITFSLYENSDKFAHQAPAAFVMGATIDAPGDGVSMLEFTGNAATRYRVGIGKSTTNNSANTITLISPSEAKRFPIGAQVMVIKSNGTTRSTDTPNGSYRTVTDTDTVGGIVTLSGAVLTDSDGSTTPVYLVYAEPSAPVGIRGIQTGLVGSMSVDGLGGVQDCARNTKVTIEENHELVNYCFGTSGLAFPYFISGGRLNVTVETTFNMNDDTIEWLYDLDQFTAQDLFFIIGDSATRHFRVDLPKVVFKVPSVEIPNEGSVPFTSTGTALETGYLTADEITVSYL